MIRGLLDLRVYLVTDGGLGDEELVAKVRLAARNGVTLVQLRDKAASTERRIELAEALRRVLDPLRVPLIINDDVEAAQVAGAAGVHLGQSDTAPALARQRLGPAAVIGLSIERVDQACNLDRGLVDYAAVSPVFATLTKADIAPPLGLEGVTRLRQLCDCGIVAIGGVNAGNVAQVIEAGADGVAVVTAVLAAADPGRAARELRAAVDTALNSRASTRAG